MNDEIVCEVCGAVVERNKYERHIKYGHKEKRENRCHLCQKHFTSLYNLQYHLAHHLNARNFLCNECPRAYNTAADLSQHQRIHEKQRDPYKCSHCGLQFQIRSKYNTHMRIHQTPSSKGPRECQICKKMFVCLSSHNRIVHLGLRTYECSECGKSFGKKSGLDRHTLTVHKKIRGFKCEVEGCNGAFGEKSQLTKHMKIHFDKDISYCSFCKLHFDDIKGHFEIEHKDLTHTCKICCKKFSKQKSLSIHIKVFHTMEKNFFCDLCPDKGFAERSQLKRHFRSHQERIKHITLEKEEVSDQENGEMEHSEAEEVSSEPHECSIDHTPEQVFLNDQLELKVEPECLLETPPDEDALIEIKSEVFSEDEDRKDIKNETSEFIKSEQEEYSSRYSLIKANFQIEKLEIQEQEMKIKNIKQPSTKKYRCRVCNEHFPNRDSFKSHFIEAHSSLEEEDFLACHGCGKAFIDKTDLQKHFDENHRTSYGVSCQKCNKRFKKQNDLRNHFLAFHTEVKFKCDVCDRLFNYKSALDRHKRIVHENQRDHVCTTCGKSFGYKFDLRKHIEVNHDESKKAQRTCQTCGKIFSKERNLQMHVLAIHNEKSFECEICGKKFSFKSAKDRHIKVVHYNQRSHQCIECQKVFGTKSDLMNHIAYNHSVDPHETGKYHCLPCEKSFISSCSLKRHQKGVHENIKQNRPRDYRCKFCKEIFSNKYQKEKHLAQVHQDGLKLMRSCRLCEAEFQLFDDFKMHIDSHANCHICLICGVAMTAAEALITHMEDHKHVEMELRRFICDFCGHRVFNKIQLKVHMRKHMKETSFYVCDICGQSYKYIAPFLYHKKVHEGKKDFICTYCGRAFFTKLNLTIHTRSHTLEKPFKCKVCDKRFAAKQILYMHLQTHSSTRKTFSCEACGLKFADRNQAKRHDESKHPDRCPFWCHICKKSFKLVHLLKIHQKHKHKTEDINNQCPPNELLAVDQAVDSIFSHWNQ